MKKLLLTGGVVALSLAAAGGVWVYQEGQDVQVESLCAGDLSSDAAVAANTTAVALVTVLERGEYDAEAADPGGVQTFKVRTEQVFKGDLPARSEITQSVPGPSGEEPSPDPRYRVLQPGKTLASQTASGLGPHWKAETAKEYVDPPCDDTSAS
ncbi:hypothetical protein AB0C52_24025 [Streptomyces sp. NPDC048717]|uniref:hypothetical protein n=1 Tax=Streptomyces sp. NPDC048717 TaxID=3154928 RepID=UPI0034224556